MWYFCDISSDTIVSTKKTDKRKDIGIKRNWSLDDDISMKKLFDEMSDGEVIGFDVIR